jgi:hypothetical protein
LAITSALPKSSAARRIAGPVGDAAGIAGAWYELSPGSKALEAADQGAPLIEIGVEKS